MAFGMQTNTIKRNENTSAIGSFKNGWTLKVLK